jgi:hypothetical protein
MRIRCQDCGREYIVSARQVAQAASLGGYTCERCEGEMQTVAARSGEYLKVRAEAYHRARALRHGGKKLDKRRPRR